ncbi:MAG: metallophosphoesterase [Campylobacterales bacterium]|nr:metallophosphoesterase [Campylobacterales bacterium]
MKKLRPILITLIIGALLYALGRFGIVYYDSTLFLERAPYMQMQTATSVLFKWQSPEAEIGCVRLESREVCDSAPTRYHRVAIDGLTPATRYMYTVHSPSMGIDNEERFFETLHVSPQEVQRIWAIGDSGKAGKDQEAVYGQMMRFLGDQKLDLWLLLGDNAYSSGTQKQFNKALFTPYAPTLKTHTPWAVNGNHDARRWAFDDIFEMPTEAEAGGAPSKSEKFYALESGNVHIVMLDSHEGDMSADGKMARWLHEDLSKVNKPWIIAVLHHPPYSKGSHDSDSRYDSWFRMVNAREHIMPILERYGVDLVLSGHSHGYERSRLIAGHYETSDRFDPKVHHRSDETHHFVKSSVKAPQDGTIYNIVGSSSKTGKNPYNHPVMQTSFGRLGSLLLEVTPTRLEGYFIDHNGTIADHYSITKEVKE